VLALSAALQKAQSGSHLPGIRNAASDSESLVYFWPRGRFGNRCAIFCRFLENFSRPAAQGRV